MTGQAIPLRSQDLVFTLYGDYLLDRPAPVWAGSLIVLLGQLGLSEMAVRTVLSRLARKRWLTVEKRGTRSYYGLTRKGRKLLEEGRERIYHPPRTSTWDGSWFVVTYSIPEERRRLRDLLRVKLLWLGCGPVTNGTWITPHDVREEVRAIAAMLRVTRHVEVVQGAHLGFSTPRDLVAQCWDLATIDAGYAAFLQRWSRDYGRCRECGAGGRGGKVTPAIPSCRHPADCFVRRFLLVHEYRRFPLEDPFLPPDLLPDGWKGGEAARLFERYHDALTVPAERYVNDVCQAGEEDDVRTAMAVAAGN